MTLEIVYSRGISNVTSCRRLFSAFFGQEIVERKGMECPGHVINAKVPSNQPGASSNQCGRSDQWRVSGKTWKDIIF